MVNQWTDRRVVVTGLGVVASLGQKADVFWEAIVAGKCGINRVTSFDVSAFDAQIAAEVTQFEPNRAFPSPKEVRRADRTHVALPSETPEILC